MTIDPDGRIGADLETAARAQREMTLKHQEFITACQNGEWDRAELARQSALAFMEAHFDALAQAWRRTLELTHR